MVVVIVIAVVAVGVAVAWLALLRPSSKSSASTDSLVADRAADKDEAEEATAPAAGPPATVDREDPVEAAPTPGLRAPGSGAGRSLGAPAPAATEDGDDEDAEPHTSVEDASGPLTPAPTVTGRLQSGTTAPEVVEPTESVAEEPEPEPVAEEPESVAEEPEPEPVAEEPEPEPEESEPVAEEPEPEPVAEEPEPEPVAEEPEPEPEAEEPEPEPVAEEGGGPLTIAVSPTNGNGRHPEAEAAEHSAPLAAVVADLLDSADPEVAEVMAKLIDSADPDLVSQLVDSAELGVVDVVAKLIDSADPEVAMMVADLAEAPDRRDVAEVLRLVDLAYSNDDEPAIPPEVAERIADLDIERDLELTSRPGDMSAFALLDEDDKLRVIIRVLCGLVAREDLPARSQGPRAPASPAEERHWPLARARWPLPPPEVAASEPVAAGAHLPPRRDQAS